MYSLRDENGILKATFHDSLALEMIMNAVGEHKEIQYKGETSKRLSFVFKDDYRYVQGNIILNIWSGDRLVKL